MAGVNWFDGAIMAFVQQHLHSAAADAFFPICTYLGEAGAVWLCLAAVLLCFRKTRTTGLILLSALGMGLLLGEVLLKGLVCRPRPFVSFPEYAALLIKPPSGYSFPSGHTCSSFAAATVLLLRHRRWGIPALVLAALIGFSRVFLFVHWPTDVLAGAALGVLVGRVPLLSRRVKSDG